MSLVKGKGAQRSIQNNNYCVGDLFTNTCTKIGKYKGIQNIMK